MDRGTREGQRRSVRCRWLHLALHVRRIAGRGHLPPDRCAPIHSWLVLLRSDRIDYVEGADEELMTSLSAVHKPCARVVTSQSRSFSAFNRPRKLGTGCAFQPLLRGHRRGRNLVHERDCGMATRSWLAPPQANPIALCTRSKATGGNQTEL